MTAARAACSALPLACARRSKAKRTRHVAIDERAPRATRRPTRVSRALDRGFSRLVVGGPECRDRTTAMRGEPEQARWLDRDLVALEAEVIIEQTFIGATAVCSERHA